MVLPLNSDFSRAAGETGESFALRSRWRDKLAAASMPSGRDEEWRYIELDFDLGEYSVVSGPVLDQSATHHVTITDGATAVSKAGIDLGCAVSVGAVDTLVDGAVDIFAMAHRAFCHSGAVISAGYGKAVEEPVTVGVSAVASQAVTFPRISIDVADGAELTVVIDLVSDVSVDGLVVPHIEGKVGAGANLTVVMNQQLATATRSIGQVVFEVGRDSSLTLAEAGLGGALARWQLAIHLVGRGSSANVLGAYFGDRQQVLDYRYLMRHAAPNTYSEMFLKGAVQDDANSVFTGLIRIEEEAQHTNAFQTNRNLILSEGSSAQSVPNLEILANEVKCGHGSTVGQLDEEQRYYLMSRGLERPQADRLQVAGFFEEALARFPAAADVETLRDRLNEKFVQAQMADRV